MSQDDDGKASPMGTLRRAWVATMDTGLKASTATAATLPESEKRFAPRGAELTAVLVEEDQSYWTVADSLLNGVAVPDHIRLIFKAHWRLLPATTAPQAQPAPQPEPEPQPEPQPEARSEEDQTSAGTTPDHPPAPARAPAAAVPSDTAATAPSPPASTAAPAGAPARPSPPAPAPAPAPASTGRAETTVPRPKDPPKVPTHRRLFAAFRRQLTRK